MPPFAFLGDMPFGLDLVFVSVNFLRVASLQFSIGLPKKLLISLLLTHLNSYNCSSISILIFASPSFSLKSYLNSKRCNSISVDML